MGKRKVIAALAAAAASSMTLGCESHELRNVTLASAMEQVGEGFYRMQFAAHNAPQNLKAPPDGAFDYSKAPALNRSFGLYADYVVVTFAVGGSKERTDKKGFDLTLAAPPIYGTKADASFASNSSSSTTFTKSNTITVVLRNPTFSPPGTLAHDIITGICCAAQPGKSDAADMKPKKEGEKPAPKEGAAAAAAAPAAGDHHEAGATASNQDQPQDRAADRVIAFEQFMRVVTGQETAAAKGQGPAVPGGLQPVAIPPTRE